MDALTDDRAAIERKHHEDIANLLPVVPREMVIIGIQAGGSKRVGATPAAPRRRRTGHRPSESRTPPGTQLLKGRTGDRANAVLATAGYNFSHLLLLRWLERLLRALFQALFPVFATAQIGCKLPPKPFFTADSQECHRQFGDG